MKYKKSIIVIILAVFLISIAAASASDVNETAMASDDNPALAVEDNDETGSEILTDGQYTYSDLREQIGSGGDINITNGYYTYNNDGSTIEITDSGVIDGNGAVIDMAGSDIRCFYVSASRITIKNLTIKNAKFNNGGGAIYFRQSGTVKNCNFVNNSVTGNSDGGAIYFDHEGIVENCSFVNNTASAFGGAVFFSGSAWGVVKNSNFTNNFAQYAGGAIRMDSGDRIENCNFIGNYAKEYHGGAIYFINYGTVRNCNFTNNDAGQDGGGALYFAYDGELTNCDFTNNSAGGGGAVFFNYGGKVTDCNFTGNAAFIGSAIYFDEYSSTKTVSNSIFLNNRVSAEALEITKNENNITITFTANDNLINAIYSKNDAEVSFTNVTYWNGKEIVNTDSSTPSISNRVAGQNITVCVVVNDTLVLNEVKVTDENGMIVLDMNVGDNYFIGACHDTDSYYNETLSATSKNTKFNVNVISKTVTNRAVNITAKSDIPNEVIKGKLLFILPNGEEINANYGGNGLWWALYTFDDYTKYQVNASYKGWDNVAVNNATITINQLKTKLSANAITTAYNANKKLVITLKDSTGKPLSGVKIYVYLKGVKTYTTNSKGQVKVQTKGLAPKTYTAKIVFKGNIDYIKSAKNVKVTVKKATPKITAKAKTFKVSAKTKKYTITLKSSGKAIKKAKVILKVNGKTYKAKTNSKGKATFKIKKLTKKGKYKATVTFKANKYYNKVAKKVIIKIK